MYSALEQSVTTLADGQRSPGNTSKIPRVGYDARFSIGQYRGMGRYLRRFVRGHEQEFLPFCATGEASPDLPVIAGGSRFYPIWEQVSVPRLVQRYGIDVFIAPYNTAPLHLPAGTKLVLILHDLMFMRNSQEIPLSGSAYQNAGRLYRRMVVPRAIRRAHRIVCVSQQTRRELMQSYPVSQEIVHYIPNTVPEEWFQVEQQPMAERVILCIAGEAPNKNLERGLQAYAILCRETRGACPALYVAGVKPAFHDRYLALAAKLGVMGRVKLLHYLPDDELRRIYGRAALMFFPSTHEGFGIPVLEALAAGVPVIASGLSCIAEVAGGAALYFDPRKPDEMASRLGRALSDHSRRQAMVEAGRQRAQQFHPRKVDAVIAAFWKGLLVE